jgi:hypothetical protein
MKRVLASVVLLALFALPLHAAPRLDKCLAPLPGGYSNGYAGSRACGAARLTERCERRLGADFLPDRPAHVSPDDFT